VGLPHRFSRSSADALTGCGLARVVVSWLGLLLALAGGRANTPFLSIGTLVAAAAIAVVPSRTPQQRAVCPPIHYNLLTDLDDASAALRGGASRFARAQATTSITAAPRSLPSNACWANPCTRARSAPSPRRANRRFSTHGCGLRSRHALLGLDTLGLFSLRSIRPR